MPFTASQVRAELHALVRTFRADLDRRSFEIPLQQKMRLSAALDKIRTIIRNRSTRSSYFTELEIDLLDIEIDSFIALIEPDIGGRLIERDILDVEGRTVVGHEQHSWLTLAEQMKVVLESIPNELIEQDEQKFEFIQGNLPLLSDVVPNQKVSPVHFDIKNERLVLTHHRAEASIEDSQNVFQARSMLIQSGRKIIEELQRSNCDRRFLDDVVAVQEQLESAQDIIRLGILNIACEEQRKEFEPELPGLLVGKLRAQCANIAMYVAQFPEWLRYAENASEVELSAEDIQYSQQAANEIAAQFEAIPAKVDPEVPRTLRAISEAVSDPATATKRVSFALVRTLENLFIRIFAHVSKFTDEFTSQSLAKVAKVASSAVSISFGTLILGYATNLAAIYEKVPGMAWLKTAVDLFKKIVASSS
ncbi:hypothetical protein E2F50_08970 [Rhizobium deserti]|uniref:Uncharacterized protein n=1 Tax=Rhizobium deserti TaxID=2547961 RepID=A0A4R5UJJ8_9HYPH|nr:hypothetical protein [Rhizobium deserti]TDK37026.1 hypothetical protein E2F50_08970 [Rhizobium deserti]